VKPVATGQLTAALDHHRAGRLQEAEQLYRAALQSPSAQPANEIATAHFNLGMILQQQGKLAEAAVCFESTLTLRPDFHDAHVALGIVQQMLGQQQQAMQHYAYVLQRNPQHVDALYNLALAYQAQNDQEKSISCYRQALTQAPDYVPVLLNLGNALLDRGDYAEAATCYRKILASHPQDGRALGNLGNALKTSGDLNAAITSLRKAADAHPAFAHVHYANLGAVQKDLGQHDAAVASLRKALEKRPDYAEAQSNLLYTLSQSPEFKPAEYLAEARSYGKQLAAQVRPYRAWRTTGAKASLKVGLVSGDLKHHPVGFFLESLLAELDPARVRLVAYTTARFSDAVTERLKSFFQEWHIIAGLSDAEAAQQIHQDAIDILIDLSGHTAHNRLPLFAWKPAPVQVTWLGYFASTGVPGMDYLLADPRSVPESHSQDFTEQICYLPETRLCFTPPSAAESLPITPLPAKQNGYITFGNYQVLTKINDEVLRVWARVLQALPQSRLRVQNTQFKMQSIQREFLQRLANAGIGPDRVQLEGPLRREDYLNTYAQVDMLLDTFPFPGGTTTCEALWMGVPTLTLEGETLLARQGASLLACAGLEDWIARDADEYVHKAVAFAADIESLAHLRQQLRPQILASPLCDAARFARNFEAALWGMWQDKMGIYSL
jgi:protein O-GlcNAc transferase